MVRLFKDSLTDSLGSSIGSLTDSLFSSMDSLCSSVDCLTDSLVQDSVDSLSGYSTKAIYSIEIQVNILRYHNFTKQSKKEHNERVISSS